MKAGSFSGATAVSSTKPTGLASPRTLISRPRPASRMRHMSRWRGRARLRNRGVAAPAARPGGGGGGEAGGDRGLRVAGELDEEDAAGVALDEGGEMAEAGALAAAVDDRVVDQLDGGDGMLQRRDRRLRRLDDALEVHGGDALDLRQRHEAHLPFGDDGERALRAGDHARDA